MYLGRKWQGIRGRRRKEKGQREVKTVREGFLKDTVPPNGIEKKEGDFEVKRFSLEWILKNTKKGSGNIQPITGFLFLLGPR